MAEASGLVVQLTRWALRSACRQLAAAEAMLVNVNIAGQDLCEAGFADFVRDTIEEHGLPAGCLTLELTENTLMQRIDGALPAPTSLRRSGVGVMMAEDIETAEQRARPKQAG